jgi:HAD superfamily hydrolase (TIGR01549 family)
LIAFDLDGTLVDSRLDLINSVNVLRQEYRQAPLDFETSWRDVCRGMPHLYAACFPRHVQEDPELSSRFEAAYIKRIFQTTQVYDGIEHVLAQLAQNASLSVVTNKPQVATERLLECAGLRGFFEVIVGGDRCEAPKPSAIPLRFAHDAANDGHNLLMVGDSLGDVKCGKASSAQTVWCNWGYWRHTANDAHFSIEAPGELIDIVDANHRLIK